MTIKQYYLMAEVAERLKVSKWTVRRYINEGKLKAVYLNPGRQGIRVLGESLATFQEELERKAVDIDDIPKNEYIQNMKHRRIISSGVKL